MQRHCDYSMSETLPALWVSNRYTPEYQVSVSYYYWTTSPPPILCSPWGKFSCSHSNERSDNFTFPSQAVSFSDAEKVQSAAQAFLSVSRVTQAVSQQQILDIAALDLPYHENPSFRCYDTNILQRRSLRCANYTLKCTSAPAVWSLSESRTPGTKWKYIFCQLN